ncbi:MAG: hypothetical protein KIT22_17405 [Verrucomicrobiae bacterium]|nr:hypothetical protein [Verrucomicrobiae bacterium]
MRLRAFILFLLLGSAGCEYLAPPHQSWTEARVIGRVVDGQTRTPVPGARITRVHAGPEAGAPGGSYKGGPQMVNRPVLAVTDRDGRFELKSVKTAYLFLESFPDYAVTLQVQASDYALSRTLFTNVTWAGGDKKTEPRIEAGDISVWRESRP